MATILFKVFTLTLKTATKPLASRFESYILNHPGARQHIIKLAQRLHHLDVSIRRGAEGRVGRTFVADMTEENAMQLASKVVTEGFVYVTGIGLVLLEMNRKSKEDAVKKDKEERYREHIKSLHDQHLRAERELRESMRTLGGQVHKINERLAFMEQKMGEPKGSRFLFF